MRVPRCHWAALANHAVRFLTIKRTFAVTHQNVCEGQESDVGSTMMPFKIARWGLDVAYRLVVRIERIAQVANILCCGVARCVTRQTGLKQGTRILEMADAAVIGEQIFGTARQRCHNNFSVRGCDTCPRTGPEIDNARPLQMKQRLADRCPANAELRHELTF